MSSEPDSTATADADEVERRPCPRCLVEPGSPCRSRSGTVAGAYHTGRFMKVPRLADHLTAHGIALEGLNAASRKGNHGGRPPVITEDMLHTVLRRRARGESIADIRKDLIIPTGKRKGQNPSPASIYRAWP